LVVCLYYILYSVVTYIYLIPIFNRLKSHWILHAPVPNYKHIVVKDDTKQRLGDEKPEGETWDRYLRRTVLGDE